MSHRYRSAQAAAMPVTAMSVTGTVCLFLILPLLAVVPMSFSDTQYLAMPRGSLSTRHYAPLFQDPDWARSVRDSLLVALPASVLAVAWGTAFSLGAWRRSSHALRLLQVLMLGPLIVPAIIHAVAYHRALSLLGLFDSTAGTILVHTVKGLPFVVLAVTAALSSVDRASLNVARSLGATEAQSLWRIVLPQARSGIAVGFLFAFITSWDEIVVTLFITSRNVHTLPKQIWEGLFYDLDPTVCALGSIALLITLTLVISTGTSRRRFSTPDASPSQAREPIR